ncbi:DUF1254 domain-containing protein [Agromyces sp. NPDC055520]
MTDATASDLAVPAYVYYFPLVENLRQVRRYVETGVGQNHAAPYNTFSHARKLATDEDTFVTINNDTVYSMAQLDLSNGPLLLSVPKMGDRYFVLQFVDAWTNNIAYVGTRATGGDGGDFLIVPPGYEGAPGAPDVPRIEASTSIVSIVGRIACAGDDDIPAVIALQDEMTITPILRSLVPPRGVAETAPVDDELRFWEEARAWSLAYPPSADDQAMQQGFAELGVTAAESPYIDPDPALRDRLVAGEAAGKQQIEDLTRHGHAPVKNGWTVGLHMFDYNVSHFSLGAIDSPEWQIADPKLRFVERAVATRVGLWGNHAYEAVYAQAFTDVSGAPLDGASVYTMTFPTDPPVNAFWSITMYSVPDFFLVANPIGRYSIGDRTAGIVRDDDGSLTITITHDEPTDAAARANWLPSPAGVFRLVFRLYAPQPPVLDLSYEFPPIEKQSRAELS